MHNYPSTLRGNFGFKERQSTATEVRKDTEFGERKLALGRCWGICIRRDCRIASTRLSSKPFSKRLREQLSFLQKLN
jgi:hypothetical protein